MPWRDRLVLTIQRRAPWQHSRAGPIPWRDRLYFVYPAPPRFGGQGGVRGAVQGAGAVRIGLSTRSIASSWGMGT